MGALGHVNLKSPAHLAAKFASRRCPVTPQLRRARRHPRPRLGDRYGIIVGAFCPNSRVLFMGSATIPHYDRAELPCKSVPVCPGCVWGSDVERIPQLCATICTWSRLGRRDGYSLLGLAISCKGEEYYHKQKVARGYPCSTRRRTPGGGPVRRVRH